MCKDIFYIIMVFRYILEDFHHALEITFLCTDESIDYKAAGVNTLRSFLKRLFHCLGINWGTSPPNPLGFIALEANGWAKRAAYDGRPIRIATCVGARVASQRCPILHTGVNTITNFFTK